MSSRRRTYGVSDGIYKSSEFYSVIAFFNLPNDEAIGNEVDYYLCYSDNGLDFHPVEYLYSSDYSSNTPMHMSITEDELVYIFSNASESIRIYEYDPFTKNLTVIGQGYNKYRISNLPFQCHNSSYYADFNELGKYPYVYNEYGSSSSFSKYTYISCNSYYYKYELDTVDKYRTLFLYRSDGVHSVLCETIPIMNQAYTLYCKFTILGLLTYNDNGSTLYLVKDGKFNRIGLDMGHGDSPGAFHVAIVNECKEIQLYSSLSGKSRVYDLKGNLILDNVTARYECFPSISDYTPVIHDNGSFKSHYHYADVSKYTNGEYVTSLRRSDDRDYFRSVEECNVDIPPGHTRRYQVYYLTCYVPDALFKLEM